MDDTRRAPNAIEAALLEDDAQDLYDNAPCGYLSTLSDGIIVKVNDTLLQWTGYTRDELLDGRRWSDLLTIGGRIFYETHFAPLLRMQESVREIAFELLRRDGQLLPVLVNAAFRRARRDGPGVIRLTLFDVTDRRRYERELLLARRQAEDETRARNDLIATISHDVRTPLNAISMAATLLENSDPKPEQRQFIRVLRSSTANAIALVDGVLEMSRLESGQVGRRDRELDLAALARDVVARLELLAAGKPGVALTCTIDPQVPARMLGDRGKLEQVLTNLLSNAVKFTHEGLVSLVISVHELTDETATLEIMVSDTGIGIPADRLPHIFEEFTQGSDEIAERYGGSGLGLAIVRKLLSLYQSELSVTSTLGQGTTFRFLITLPRA